MEDNLKTIKIINYLWNELKKYNDNYGISFTGVIQVIWILNIIIYIYCIVIINLLKITK